MSYHRNSRSASFLLLVVDLLLLGFASRLTNGFRNNNNYIPRSRTTTSSSLLSKSSTRLFGTMKFKNFDYFLESLSMNNNNNNTNHGDGGNTENDDQAPPAVLLCFTTSMCGPCKLMNKELQHVNDIIKKKEQQQQQQQHLPNYNNSNGAESSKPKPKRQKQQQQQYNQNQNQNLKLYSIDTEKFPQLSTRFDISRLPCIIFIKSGEVVCRMEGVTKAEDIIRQIEQYELK